MSTNGGWAKLIQLVLLTLASTWSGEALAETFTMTPDDDWTVLENAQAGDIVEIAPGTYQFRVYLSNAGTADNPIIIRAQDPENRPVWDLVGDSEDTFVNTWPGSYGAGDNHRGCWQVAAEGAYYDISGIVFQNCRAPSSAGMRMINSGPVTLRDCVFQHNTNGLTGASTDLVVEHSEFFQNGKTLTEGNATHHIYIFGGVFTLRHSYLHDGHEGQAFHIRARESTIEYNWITRPANYVGDIMTCEQFCGDEPQQQTMLVRGNVIVQGEPSNGSQLFALFRDAEEDTSARMDLSLVHNTIIGTPRGGDHNLVNLRNDTVSAYVHASNNIIYNVGSLVGVEQPGSDNWGVDGAGNWLSDGIEAADALTDSLLGADPGFVDVDGSNFTLVRDGDAVGAAAPDVEDAPDREYYRDEELAMLWRERTSHLDCGAFESTTASDPVGPYGDVPDNGPDETTPDGTDIAVTDSSEPDAPAETDVAVDGATDVASATDAEPEPTTTDVASSDGAEPATETEAELPTDEEAADKTDTGADSDPANEDVDQDSTNADAGVDATSSGDDGDCGCRIIGRQSPNGAFGIGWLLLGALALRRRVAQM